MESNIHRIVARYETHEAQDDIKPYLKGISGKIVGNLVDFGTFACDNLYQGTSHDAGTTCTIGPVIVLGLFVLGDQ